MLLIVFVGIRNLYGIFACNATVKRGGVNRQLGVGYIDGHNHLRHLVNLLKLKLALIEGFAHDEFHFTLIRNLYFLNGRYGNNRLEFSVVNVRRTVTAADNFIFARFRTIDYDCVKSRLGIFESRFRAVGLYQYYFLNVAGYRTRTVFDNERKLAGCGHVNAESAVGSVVLNGSRAGERFDISISFKVFYVNRIGPVCATRTVSYRRIGKNGEYTAFASLVISSCIEITGNKFEACVPELRSANFALQVVSQVVIAFLRMLVTTFMRTYLVMLNRVERPIRCPCMLMFGFRVGRRLRQLPYVAAVVTGRILIVVVNVVYKLGVLFGVLTGRHMVMTFRARRSPLVGIRMLMLASRCAHNARTDCARNDEHGQKFCDFFHVSSHTEPLLIFHR